MTNDEDNGASSVWRYAMAKRAHVIVDADGYFKLAREAMANARQRVFMIGWDFDTRIHLSGGRRWFSLRNRRGRYPARLGAFIVWLVRRQRNLEVRILKWNFSFIKSLFRGSMIVDLARWALKPRIDFKLDSAHPIGCSHHQKIVTIDDCVAVCGGIDMTSDRWDTRAHLHEDVRRRLPNGRRYDPWHDITMMMEGQVAAALAELGRERWIAAGGKPLEPCRPQSESPWPERLVAEFENVEIGIARTRAKFRDAVQINEIELLFLEQIARAKRFVYAETQYFASRKIGEAIAKRLAEPDPPEFVILNPLHADGWLEQTAMDSARERLLASLRPCDHADRLRVYIPYTSGGTPIYVHAKLMIVDDEILRVGSANMNNRSMGLDSECDVFLDTRRAANRDIGPAITRLRHSLLAEHCGMEIDEIAEALDREGSMHKLLDRLPQSGRRLERYHPMELTEVEKTLADRELLDPERPEERFEPISKRGLFRRTGLLRKPR